jgi:hypothetical protein
MIITAKVRDATPPKARSRLSSARFAGICTVSVTAVAAVPAGMEAGENVAVAPEGSPVTVRATAAGRIAPEGLRDRLYVPSIQASILSKLIRHDVPGARQWAEETIKDDFKDERGFEFSKALLTTSYDAGRNVLWPLIQSDTQFGRELLEAVSYGQLEKNAFTASFSDSQLGEIFSWLLEQYPPGDDRRASGAMGPVDTIRFLRDGTLERLKQRATFDACDALMQTELRFPQYRWLRFHFDQAELMACAVTWEAPTPKDILAMATDKAKRFVESGEQLLDAVLESLTHLQTELHDELAAVGDLWNSNNKDWWPKQEEDVSDYIARFLRKDLVERGIIVNREVQIRRGRRGEMAGQNTDIHVDSTPSDDAQAAHYGSIRLVIEVKGSWNDGLMTDMKDQLRDRYLKNNRCRIGLYVVAYFKADRWVATDSRRSKSDALDFDELQQRLSEQAVDISGGATLRSFVLDASLNSTQSSAQDTSR